MVQPSLEEGIKVHRFAGIFPAQFFTEAGRHREAVVAADQRMVIRSYRDDLAGFVYDVSHAHYFWRQSSGSVDILQTQKVGIKYRKPLSGIETFDVR